MRARMAAARDARRVRQRYSSMRPISFALIGMATRSGSGPGGFLTMGHIMRTGQKAVNAPGVRVAPFVPFTLS